MHEFTPFSKSIIWKLQNERYQNYGPEAWSEKGVPFYLTSCPWTAYAYYQVVKGFAKDLKKETLHLVDLGSGSGRFGYYFLKEWEKEKPFLLKYTMVDTAEKNLQFCKKHPLLQPWVKQEILQFSSKLPENVDGILANYFFDTIPQELFKIEKKKIFLGHVRVLVDEENSLSLFQNIKFDLQFLPFTGYQEKVLDEILQKQAEELVDGTFLFPAEGLRYLERIQSPALLLAADQAVSTLQQLKDNQEPKLASHATFSTTVSYHTLRKYFQHSWIPEHPAIEFAVLGAVKGEGVWKETARCFSEYIGKLDPYRYFQQVNARENKIVSAQDWLHLIQWGKDDPMTFAANFEKIRLSLQTITSIDRRMWLDEIAKLEEQIYPLSNQEGYIYLNLGVLAYDLKDDKRAEKLFIKAQKLLPHDADIHKNISILRRKKIND